MLTIICVHLYSLFVLCNLTRYVAQTLSKPLAENLPYCRANSMFIKSDYNSYNVYEKLTFFMRFRKNSLIKYHLNWCLISNYKFNMVWMQFSIFFLNILKKFRNYSIFFNTIKLKAAVPKL